jgi:glucokinase
MVAPAVEAPVVIGLDVGGTKILSGLVDRDGQVLAEHEVPSPDGSAEGVLAALDAAVEALLDERVQAIGYGIPANLERGTGPVLWATNLPLTDVDVLGRARKRFGLPVGIENDASAAALAEWRLGAGRGVSNVLMITLGTGVGVASSVTDGCFVGGSSSATWWSSRVVASARAEAPVISRCSRPAAQAIASRGSSTGRRRTPTCSSSTRMTPTSAPARP